MNSAASLPIGPAVDPSPARLPGDVKLEGHRGAVERLDPLRHGADLWNAVKGDDTLWTYMNYGPFGDAHRFGEWLTERAALSDPLYYAILDRDGRAAGLVTLLEIRPAMRVIEVGHIVYGTPLQRTAVATEAQYLLARYVFETLGYRRCEWKCDSLNAASRGAAARYGFVFEGIFRQHMIRRGHNRDTAWFSMLDSEWPSRRVAFEQWLSPANFDAQGRQKTSLRALQSAAQSR